MLKNDAFSQQLGIEIVAVGRGHCTLTMRVTNEMLNGFQMAHGGITYSLSDSAFAFAANTYGFHCVSFETSISHVKKVTAGQILNATAKEKYRSKKTGIYEVMVRNDQDDLVALFQGHAHVSEKSW